MPGPGEQQERGAEIHMRGLEISSPTVWPRGGVKTSSSRLYFPSSGRRADPD